jgi:hypothetical protein
VTYRDRRPQCEGLLDGSCLNGRIGRSNGVFRPACGKPHSATPPSPAARNAAYGSFTRRYALVSGRRDRHGIALGPAEATARHGANAKSNSDRWYSSLGALPRPPRISKSRAYHSTPPSASGPLPRRPERRLGLVEAIGRAAVRAVRRYPKA